MVYDHALIGAREDDGRLSYGYDAVHVKSASHALLEAFRDGYRDEHLAFVTVERRRAPRSGRAGRDDRRPSSRTPRSRTTARRSQGVRRVADGRNPDIEIHRQPHARRQRPCRAAARVVRRPLGRRQRNRHETISACCRRSCARRARAGSWPARACGTCSSRSISAPSRSAATSPARPNGSARRPPRCTHELADAFGGHRAGPAALDRELDAILARMEQTIGDVSVLGPYRAGLTGLVERRPMPSRLRYAPSASTATSIWVRRCAPSRAGSSSTSRASPTVHSPSAPRPTRRSATSPGCCGRSTTLPAPERPSSVSTRSTWSSRTPGTGATDDAFLRGYGLASDLDVKAYQPLLRAYEAEKAVYEVGYEAGNRPAWLPIPCMPSNR